MNELSFSYDLEIDGYSVPTKVLVEYSIYQEMYGCDYDGNRGEMRTFIDKVSFKIIGLLDTDMTEAVKTKLKIDYDIIENMVNKEIERAINENC